MLAAWAQTTAFHAGSAVQLRLRHLHVERLKAAFVILSSELGIEQLRNRQPSIFFLIKEALQRIRSPRTPEAKQAIDLHPTKDRIRDHLLRLTKRRPVVIGSLRASAVRDGAARVVKTIGVPILCREVCLVLSGEDGNASAESWFAETLAVRSAGDAFQQHD